MQRRPALALLAVVAATAAAAAAALDPSVQIAPRASLAPPSPLDWEAVPRQCAGERLLTYTAHSGFTNQLLEFASAVRLAVFLNRTLVVPPVLPHKAAAPPPRQVSTALLLRTIESVTARLASGQAAALAPPQQRDVVGYFPLGSIVDLRRVASVVALVDWRAVRAVLDGEPPSHHSDNTFRSERHRWKIGARVNGGQLDPQFEWEDLLEDTFVRASRGDAVVRWSSVFFAVQYDQQDSSPAVAALAALEPELQLLPFAPTVVEAAASALAELRGSASAVACLHMRVGDAHFRTFAQRTADMLLADTRSWAAGHARPLALIITDAPPEGRAPMLGYLERQLSDAGIAMAVRDADGDVLPSFVMDQAVCACADTVFGVSASTFFRRVQGLQARRDCG